MPPFNSTTTDSNSGLDDMSLRLRREALEALEEEPELGALLYRTVLAKGVETFEDAVAATVCYRLLLHPCNPKMATEQPMFCPNSLRKILQDALQNDSNSDDSDDEVALENGHTMKEAVRRDALAVLDRDPACDTLLEVVLFYKGFSALVCHRAARQKWMHFRLHKKQRRSMTALFLQSQCSAVFGVDIHPGATIGAGILLDHGTGIVIGETAVLGDGCTLLHGVTLGGTGKDLGDRHPKVGKHVLIGAGTSILGNIVIGNRAKIGAGSIVLRAIPAGATAVGSPAKVIGRTVEADPASSMDDTLQNVAMLHASKSVTKLNNSSSSSTLATEPTNGSSSSSSSSGVNSDSESSSDEESPPGCFCPFRDYVTMANRAPKDTITILTLRKLLLPEGCSHTDIHSVFFELDTRNVGYMKLDDCQQNVRDVLQNNTSLPLTRIDAILSDYLEQQGHHHDHHAAAAIQVQT